MSTLGSRLRSARERKGWSQTEICKKLKISNSTLSGYERDYRKPHPDMIKTFADLYEVTADYLIGNNKANKDKNDEIVDSLTEITRLAQKYGLEQLGFFDIEEWKNLSPEEIRMLDAQFKAVAEMAKQRNEKK